MFEQMWTLAHGLGAMCATKVCSLNEEEIGERLSVAFAAHIMLIKSGRLEKAKIDVEKLNTPWEAKKSINKFPFEK